jgi:hypothetical protein
MALNSPGVQVTIIDESQYLPAAPNSVPLIVVATAQNKSNAAGTSIAVGTTSANANKLYQITSQRDLVTYFGNPFFYKTTNGTPIHGYELNEYGLLTAYSTLGSTNLAYVVRADVDLAELVGRTGRPSSEPDDGQYWLNTASSTWGIFEFNKVTGVFTNKPAIVITDAAEIVGGVPSSTIGNIGDYAINATVDYNNNPDTYQTYWFKDLSNTWVAVGSPEWQAGIPAVQGTLAPTLIAPVVPGIVVFATNDTPVTVSGYIDDNSTPGTYSTVAGTTLTLSASTTIANYTYISGTGIAPGTFIVAGGTGTTFTVSISQATPSAVITGYEAKAINTAATTVAGLVADINAAKIPYVTAAEVDGKLTMFGTSPTAVVTITAASNSATLASVGITAGSYGAPVLAYGTNAQQPLWRTTDASPRPTGSVWIKTNNVNSGVNLAVSQYSVATAAWSSKTVRVATSDWAINAALDVTGGKSIAINSVYAQAGAQYGPSAPVQLFSRAATGPSVFVGTTTPSFMANSILDVYVSVPGSSALSSKYTVTILGTTADDFVIAWTAANIPHTTATIDTTGAIVLTHTEGGVIVLDDAPSLYGAIVYTSPIVGAGFTLYDPVTMTGTLGAKPGPFKTVNLTPGLPGIVSLPTTNVVGTGTGLTLQLTVSGNVPTFTIVVAGSGYATGDIVSVVGGGVTYELEISTTTGLTNIPTVLTVISAVPGLAPLTPQYTLQLSNWEITEYIADTTTPVNAPTTGTKWFHSVANQVDILTNYGGNWFSYNQIKYGSNGLPVTGINAGNNPAGPICQANEPTLQTDGTPLVYGDLWIDTGDLENYPVISRWQQVAGVDQWVLIDNTDQTTENGVLFADARWGGSGSVDPVNDPVPTVDSLLTNTGGVAGGAYLDLDAPSASEYPSGTLLFNTRRSGYVVKEFRAQYFNGTDFADVTLPSQIAAWVTVSGNKSDGSPYMGRKAQRAMVVQALRVCIDTTSDLREDQTFFNLMVCPGYPELQPNMVALNNDRNNTSYIIGDSPLRLAADANAITAWATNSAGATGSGEDGLVTRDTYLGVYYPSGITTDLTGTEVVVPASHMILRTMLYNDSVAYPWFAPAGQRRGIIDNANNIGYIDSASGEFQTTQNRVALRDIEYTNYINPIAFFNNLGLLNFGNKNTFASQSALDRTNVSRLVAYIRDRLAVAVRPFLFEPNDSMTRTQARAVCQTLLADIMTKRGIYDYVVVCDETNNTPARIDRNELWIDIAVEPVKAVEFIYIPVRILNTGEIKGL